MAAGGGTQTPPSSVAPAWTALGPPQGLRAELGLPSVPRTGREEGGLWCPPDAGRGERITPGPTCPPVPAPFLLGKLPAQPVHRGRSALPGGQARPGGSRASRWHQAPLTAAWCWVPALELGAPPVGRPVKGLTGSKFSGRVGRGWGNTRLPRILDTSPRRAAGTWAAPTCPPPSPHPRRPGDRNHTFPPTTACLGACGLGWGGQSLSCWSPRNW